MLRYRLIVLTLLLSSLILINYFDPIKTPCWTSHHWGQGYNQFIKQAVNKVKHKFPQWYNPKTKIMINTTNTLTNNNIAYTYQPDGKTIVIELTFQALKLCTTDDLSSVILHEFVHVKLWNSIRKKFPKQPCNNIRHELMANLTVIKAYDQLQKSKEIHNLTIKLYNHFYIKAVERCSPNVYQDLSSPLDILNANIN